MSEVPVSYPPPVTVHVDHGQVGFILALVDQIGGDAALSKFQSQLATLDHRQDMALQVARFAHLLPTVAALGCAFIRRVVAAMQATPAVRSGAESIQTPAQPETMPGDA